MKEMNDNAQNDNNTNQGQPVPASEIPVQNPSGSLVIKCILSNMK